MSLLNKVINKPIDEAIDILCSAYEEKQASMTKQALDSDSRNALIGALTGAGLGGLGMTASNLIKGKKLSMRDALYGALLGSVPGAATGYIAGDTLSPFAPEYLKKLINKVVPAASSQTKAAPQDNLKNLIEEAKKRNAEGKPPVELTYAQLQEAIRLGYLGSNISRVSPPAGASISTTPTPPAETALTPTPVTSRTTDSKGHILPQGWPGWMTKEKVPVRFGSNAELMQYASDLAKSPPDYTEYPSNFGKADSPGTGPKVPIDDYVAIPKKLKEDADKAYVESKGKANDVLLDLYNKFNADNPGMAGARVPLMPLSTTPKAPGLYSR
jgi:hypothetical protein